MTPSFFATRTWACPNCSLAAIFGTLVWVLLCVAPSMSAAEGGSKTNVSNARSRLLLLAIDDAALPLRKNVCLYLSKPMVRQDPVLVPSARHTSLPDNVAAHFYGTVLWDPESPGIEGQTPRGKFRMWYYACHGGRNPDWPPMKLRQLAKKPTWLKGAPVEFRVFQGPLCYAESDDGIAWNKPSLGQVLFKGSTNNNALELPHTIVSGAAVIRDAADPDPDRRYKMMYQFFPDQSEPPILEYGHMPSVACAVSADGLRWRVTSLPFINQFVEHCSFIQHGGKYILHYQLFRGTPWSAAYSEGGGGGGRSGAAHSTFNFDRWPDVWEWAFVLPGNNPQVHLGVGAASFGNVCVGLYGRWHDQTQFVDIQGDLGLLISNDGIRFREPVPGRAFIHRDESPPKAVQGRAFKTILCQGNGIVNVGNETRIYHGRWRNVGENAEDLAAHDYGEIALATLPRDRWGALGLNPGSREGSIMSDAFSLPALGIEILVNGDGLRGARVELVDEQFNPVPSFSGTNSGRFDEEAGLDCAVRWPNGSPVSLPSGRRFRVCVHLSQQGDQQPRLFAITLQGR